jgi:NAD kinase
VTRRIALFGGSFNPPGLHHRAVAEVLSGEFDEVVVVPCGPRPDKPVTNDVEPYYRAAMVDMAFRGMAHVRVELFDLEAATFTRNHLLERRFANQGEVWHVVGADLVQKGADGLSAIEREWEEGARLWREGRFAVVTRPGFQLQAGELPPNVRCFPVQSTGASSDIRQRAFQHASVDGLVTPEVAAFIERHGLYRGVAVSRQTRFCPDTSRLLLVADEASPQALATARAIGPSTGDDPSLVVVVGGDGTMLRAIRQHWRRRVPLYGINVGHLGFLLNDVRADAPFERDLVLYLAPLLLVEVETIGGEQKSSVAFNDAWVERMTGQTAWIEVKVNGQVRLPQLVADGALVSTAAGSTSYARAMGATPLPLDTPGLVLVGSNVLRPEFWRPAVLPLDSTVELTTLDAVKRPIQAYIDGICQGQVRWLRARVSNIAAVELAYHPGHDPATKLARIQFPAHR